MFGIDWLGLTDFVYFVSYSHAKEMAGIILEMCTSSVYVQRVYCYSVMKIQDNGQRER